MHHGYRPWNYSKLCSRTILLPFARRPQLANLPLYEEALSARLNKALKLVLRSRRLRAVYVSSKRFWHSIAFIAWSAKTSSIFLSQGLSLKGKATIYVSQDNKRMATHDSKSKLQYICLLLRQTKLAIIYPRALHLSSPSTEIVK